MVEITTLVKLMLPVGVIVSVIFLVMIIELVVAMMMMIYESGYLHKKAMMSETKKVSRLMTQRLCTLC